MDSIRSKGIEENTMIFFTSDNGTQICNSNVSQIVIVLGPWLEMHQGSGSLGLLNGRSSGYWNTGKGKRDEAIVVYYW